MKRFLLSAALLLACSGVALAQSRSSPVAAAAASRLAPVPARLDVSRVRLRTTSLEDSKMTPNFGDQQGYVDAV